MVIVSPFAGRLAARYGFRIVVTIGLALAGLGLLALGVVHADTGYGNVWWRLAVAGIGFALTMSPLTGAAIQAVSPQEGGLASGISSTTRQIGAVLGVAVLGAIVRTRRIRRRLLRGRPQQRLPRGRRRHLGQRRVHRPVAGEVQARGSLRAAGTTHRPSHGHDTVLTLWARKLNRATSVLDSVEGSRPTRRGSAR